uniref:Dynein light chain n=1 Tax=Angiostrongylus cantonensis TaxID=6313 RepID=A0A0K0DI75_ANGCA
MKQDTRDERTFVKRGTDEELSELNKQILQEQRKESQDHGLTGDDVKALQARCMRIAPIAQKVCVLHIRAQRFKDLLWQIGLK